MLENGAKNGHLGLFVKRRYGIYRIFQAGAEDMHLIRNDCISISGSSFLSSCPFFMFSVLCCCHGACYISFRSTTIHICNKPFCLEHAVYSVSREECGGGKTTWGHKVFVELQFDPESELPGASSERDWGLYLNTSFSKAFYSEENQFHLFCKCAFVLL